MKLIDADELLKKIEEISRYDDFDVLVVDWDDMIICIDNAPTIEAEPTRHGKWIKENIVLTSLPPKGRWHCSGCGSIKVGYDESVLTPYCPNCGAKMDAEEEPNEADLSGND